MYMTELLKKYELQKFWAALTPFYNNQTFPCQQTLCSTNNMSEYIQQLNCFNGNGIRTSHARML